MPGVLPDGEPVPADGGLPAGRDRERRASAASASTSTCRSAPAAAATATSTPTPPPSWAAARAQDGYADTVLAELALAARVLGRAAAGRHGLRRRRHADPAAAGRPGPDPRRRSTRPGGWRPAPRSPPRPTRSRSTRRRCGGCARPASPGSRSACSRPPRTCCAILDRQHTAGRAPQAAAEAREAGFDHVNLDLIYGTPGRDGRRLRRLARGGGRRRRGPRAARTR